MDKEFKFQKITGENASLFKDYLPERNPKRLFGDDTMGIGVLKGETPCAAIYLLKKNGCMRILYLSVDPDYRRQGIGTRLVESVIKSAKAGDLSEVQITYASNIAENLEDFLEKNRFENTSEAGLIYHIPRIFLRDFLKNDTDVQEMAAAWKKVSHWEEVLSFRELPSKAKDFFSFLNPDMDMSLAIREENGNRYKAFIVVSMFAGEYFISDMWFKKGCEEEASGLMYACFGNLYMTLTDSESFSIVVKREVGKRIMAYIFDPLILFGVYRETLHTASIKIK